LYLVLNIPDTIGGDLAEGPRKTGGDVVAVARLKVEPIEVDLSLTARTYRALKDAITSMDIYGDEGEIRLDEHQLAQDLGVSRTPIREAMCRLEQEGLVRTISRKGTFVVRKNKSEIIDMIIVWSSLESMAARLICKNASDKDIALLRKMFAEFEGKEIKANIDEYSDTNIDFHQRILSLGGCELMVEITENLFIHLSSIRAHTIGDDERYSRSIVDHMNIIEALEARDEDLAAKLVLEHNMNLAAHVKKYVDFLN
jgi:DNA-binding GntR family transcriptional regulator